MKRFMIGSVEVWRYGGKTKKGGVSYAFYPLPDDRSYCIDHRLLLPSDREDWLAHIRSKGYSVEDLCSAFNECLGAHVPSTLVKGLKHKEGFTHNPTDKPSFRWTVTIPALRKEGL